MSFAGFCGSARDREAKLGLLRRAQASHRDQVEALEIELSDALARTLDEIKN
jgi:hypothetical protein